MDLKLIYRKATLEDLPDLVNLLAQDVLGKNRENYSNVLDQRYINAFHKINKDANQYLMIAEFENRIVGTCHLTLLPSLTFIGSTRMLIEAVRVHPDFRRLKIGESMLSEAIDYARLNDAKIIQLTTNKQRPDALRFYEKLDFKATHEGLKFYLD